MEVADSIIAALISSRPVAGPKAKRSWSHTRGNRPATSQCGSCRIYVDNAKWERVFSEKFEDPDYYKSRPMWGASSFSSF